MNPSLLPVTFGGEESYACPRQHIHENPHYWAKVLKFYAMYRKGFLPDVGAISSQSNRAVELFRILDDANDACDQDEAKRAKEADARNKRAQAQRRG